MSEPITNIHGKTAEIACLSCAIVKRDIAPVGALPVSQYFDAHQDFEIPIPGFVIVASKRHIKSIDEFTAEEQLDFIQYITHIRKAMREELGIEHITLVQDEDTKHHFHMWLFPRYEWMQEFGKKVESIRPIMEYARAHLKTPENLQKVESAATSLKEALS